MSNDIMQWFASAHLPPDHPGKGVSEMIEELAIACDTNILDGAELSAGLRKLVEAKDCFVRAAILSRQTLATQEAVNSEDTAIQRAYAAIAGGVRICEYCQMKDHANCVKLMRVGTPADEHFYEGPCLCGNGCGSA